MLSSDKVTKGFKFLQDLKITSTNKLHRSAITHRQLPHYQQCLTFADLRSWLGDEQKHTTYWPLWSQISAPHCLPQATTAATERTTAASNIKSLLPLLCPLLVCPAPLAALATAKSQVGNSRRPFSLFPKYRILISDTDTSSCFIRLNQNNLLTVPMKSVSEFCSVETNTTDACLILSFGNSTRHVHAIFKKSPTTASEAEAREAVKKLPPPIVVEWVA
ncbi:hypothetical protein V6N13_068862 [Hibiscus sabdariffa]|uniref:Uncharacterized protein n=1 Tax=Hibiscus sabdariffa TaxID=183260 RepID=A0ABR2QP87_9ROSI